MFAAFAAPSAGNSTRISNPSPGREESTIPPPIAIGGGTYARAMQNGCGFGPLGEGEVSSIHQADEYISLQKIGELAEIYYRALKAIGS